MKAVNFDMYETLITLFESPIYFGTQMAADIGLPVDVFRSVWDAMEEDRTVGKIAMEEALEIILEKNQCYSEETLKKEAAKRVAAKRECFRHLHPEIIPMLSELKKRGIKLGLISNCFSEEAMVFRESILMPYFDAVYLSYEQGIQKPNKEIFMRCMNELEVTPQECVYVGDGGSCELETAETIGMKALQATWYLKEGTTQPTGRKPNFLHLNTPLEVMEYIKRDQETE